MAASTICTKKLAKKAAKSSLRWRVIWSLEGGHRASGVKGRCHDLGKSSQTLCFLWQLFPPCLLCDSTASITDRLVIHLPGLPLTQFATGSLNGLAATMGKQLARLACPQLSLRTLAAPASPGRRACACRRARPPVLSTQCLQHVHFRISLTARAWFQQLQTWSLQETPSPSPELFTHAAHSWVRSTVAAAMAWQWRVLQRFGFRYKNMPALCEKILAIDQKQLPLLVLLAWILRPFVVC